jgi:hypothetical protein
MLTRCVTGLVLMLPVVIPTHAAEADRQFINVQRDAAQARPISDGVLVGKTLYISGQLSVDPKTNRAAGRSQARDGSGQAGGGVGWADDGRRRVDAGVLY